MVTATETRTDEQIQADVQDEMKEDPRIRPNEIGVAVKDGIVMLTGWVDTFIKKWAAEATAHRVRGVKAVVNDIEIRLPSPAERTDLDIAAEAIRALKWNSLVPTDKIHVTVSRGLVTLSGTVEWQYQKEEAVRTVQRLSGVRGVIDVIIIRPGTKPSPHELKRRIEDALVRNAETDAERELRWMFRETG